MEILIISIAALLASGLTLFSGFGLGTLLMPVVAIFLPVDIAIAITAIVHLANNLFKVALLGKDASRDILLRFGLPAIAAAFFGAFLLGWLSGIPSIFDYMIFGKELRVFPLKAVVGLLILSFVILELSPRFSSISLDRKFLPLGGLISGFFGGLSGHQGAFRSMFLLKAGLSKESFVATGTLLAVMVDLSRLPVYGWGITTQPDRINWFLVASASASAFAGAYFGAKLLKKVTIKFVQTTVSVLLVIVSLGMISGAL
ncbi:MAG: hypothetical protein H6R18_944 [Proteobacteria bacterium]|nr:hypothetical protein [Pseudomonadota bacterium]